MDRRHVTARYGRPKSGPALKRGACVRVGEMCDAMAGEPRSYVVWLTLAEAESLLVDLTTAVAKAKAASPNYPPPEPPQGATAALPEAA